MHHSPPPPTRRPWARRLSPAALGAAAAAPVTAAAHGHGPSLETVRQHLGWAALSGLGLLALAAVVLVLLVLNRRLRETGERLAASEEMFRALAESAHDAIMMTDPGGRLTFWNRASETLFGWRRDEAVGRQVHELLAPERLRQAANERLAGFQHSGTGPAVGSTVQLDALRRDGSEVQVELSLSAVSLHGKWHAVALARDVTQHQQSLNALDAAKREAEAAAQAKADFLANMSHEIRTPLNGVIGMTELLLDTPLESLQREYVEVVRTSGAALLRIVDDILDFSKVEAGRLQLEEIEFDLRGCLEEVGDLLGPRAAERGVELVLLQHPEVPERVVGDPVRLRQLLINLVGNAVKFTHRGEIVVRVTRRGVADGRARLRFEVADTGIGIETERLEGLFHAFTQADTSTTRRYGGTGLGLAISRHLVELMGGEIGADSAPGRGSCFWFEITLEARPDAATGTTPVVGELTGRTVLVVDDNPTNRQLLRELLQRWGCRVLEAADGPSALDLLAARPAGDAPPDVVILDFAMPGMNGEELAGELRRVAGFARVPLVMLTSVPQAGDSERLTAAGLDAYLTKPVKRRVLAEALLKVLEPAAGGPPVAASRPRLVTRHSLSEERHRSRVLVVEDNEVNQKVATRLLQRLGLSADVTADGREAVEAVQARSYELILMDCQMPRLDGFEATRQIRALEGDRARTPIVAMTAGVLASDVERCRAAGMDGHLAKPVQLAALNEVVAQYLELPKAAVIDEPVAAEGPVDAARLRTLCGSDARFQRRLVELFLAESERYLGELSGALQAQDLEQIRQSAHALKGASANIGANRMRKVAAELEEAARQGDAATATGLAPSLDASFDAVASHLRAAYLAS